MINYKICDTLKLMIKVPVMLATVSDNNGSSGVLKQ